MCLYDEPHLATLSHEYDEQKNCIYFHCATEGKKISIFQANNRVWGQALIDHGYVQGACDHLYATTQFKGKVTFRGRCCGDGTRTKANDRIIRRPPRGTD
ncbi:MAG TPA: hypothetical protein VJL33_00205 [Candidatus Bathyarchaeia archaeon]|nr:hypothetical protein [Candidatus Bathyarchaeia archaeon]